MFGYFRKQKAAKQPVKQPAGSSGSQSYKRTNEELSTGYTPSSFDSPIYNGYSSPSYTSSDSFSSYDSGSSYSSDSSSSSSSDYSGGGGDFGGGGSSSDY